MAEIITKGYLINREDYDFFDEIITFINEFGNLFTCIALGVKKINSKNARNMFFGSLCEFEFFCARDTLKVGKLKKVKLLEPNNINLNLNPSILFLNECLYLSKLNGKKIYYFYKEIISLINKSIDNESIILYIILNFIKFSGIRLWLDSCSICKSTKVSNFSEENYGFVCKKCDYNNELKIDVESLKFIYLVFKKKFSLTKEFSYQTKMIAIKLMLYFYRNNGGPFIKL